MKNELDKQEIEANDELIKAINCMESVFDFAEDFLLDRQPQEDKPKELNFR
jgi:hypothetical protein